MESIPLSQQNVSLNPLGSVQVHEQLYVKRSPRTTLRVELSQVHLLGVSRRHASLHQLRISFSVKL